MQFPIGAPLKPSLYHQPFSRYSAQAHVNKRTHTTILQAYTKSVLNTIITQLYQHMKLLAFFFRGF